MTEKSECIRVFVRVRPPFPSELAKESVAVEGGETVHLKYDKYDSVCRYTKVFDQSSDQDEVFASITPLLRDALAGINCSVLAYGQTSAGLCHVPLILALAEALTLCRHTGKTHTMLGPDGGTDIKESQDSSWGILPRSVFYIFGELRRRVMDDGDKYQVKISYMQIYNEIINDLLREKIVTDEPEDGEAFQSGLKIREYVEHSADGSGKKQEIFVSGLSEFRVETAEDVLRLLQLGSHNRSTRSTECNTSSSRSHAILQLYFEIESHVGDGQTVINRSKLSFVDLAGSEKIITLGNDKDPKHLKELTSINKSLSSLGNVIAALAKGRRHVPYRDSKLTRLLQDSLGGNTRTLLIACVAPTAIHAAETFNTLQFADRASSVMVRVRPNVVIDDKALLARAQIEVARLKRLLRFVMSGNGDKGPGAFSLDGAGSVNLSSDHPSKQAAVLEAMAVGAQSVRAGGGDDEAAADSEMIRLLDENERLRHENAVLSQKCHRLQARLNVYQTNASGYQAGVWSPVRGPSTGHKKTKRSLTGGGLNKRRSTKSNPYVSHLPKQPNNNEAGDQSRKPSDVMRGKSAGALPERKVYDSQSLGPPVASLPVLAAREPERKSTFRIDDPYGIADDRHFAEDAVANDKASLQSHPDKMSPVRGVLRKKSRGHLAVGFSEPEAEESAEENITVPLTTAEVRQPVGEKKDSPRVTRTPKRESGVRNPYAALTPVLHRDSTSDTKKKSKRKKSAVNDPQGETDSTARSQAGRNSRIDQVRASAEWGKSEEELASIEKDLEERGKLLDSELEGDVQRLNDIQSEKQLLMQQLQDHINSMSSEADPSIIKESAVYSPARQQQVSPGRRTMGRKPDDECGVKSSTALNPPLSPISAGTRSRNNTYSESAFSPHKQSANPVPTSGETSSVDDTSGGNSFSSNVVAKTFGSTPGFVPPSSSASYHVTAPKKAPNEPARLLNSELDVGRCLQMYSFRYDSWDNFDIVDYNPEDKLHKCLFRSDRSQQWINLKKKPIRGFAAAAPDQSTGDDGNGNICL